MDSALCGEWPSFDTILSTLPYVHKLVLGFRTSEDVSRFREEALASSMPHVRAKLDCQCAIFDSDDGDWRNGFSERFFVSADPKQAAGAFVIFRFSDCP